MRRVSDVDEAVRVILAGGVVAVPTDTLYGLAADPFNHDAIARVFAIKERPREHALPLVAADVDQIVRHFGPLPVSGASLASRFWPGPLTLVIPASGRAAEATAPGSGTVAVRVPAHDLARALCRACDRPLTATSANLSGDPPTADPDVVERTVGGKIDLLLDAGATPGGPPSTIVDVTGSALQLVRAGAIAWDEVMACVRRG